MISVAEPDRDALRFLWVDDIGSEVSKTVVMRFARVAFRVPFCLTLLSDTTLNSTHEEVPEVNIC